MGTEGKTILIIEDDLDVLSAFVKNFKYLGYEVIVATDGLDGLKKVVRADMISLSRILLCLL
jgi:CheY-like chemotaxis protein